LLQFLACVPGLMHRVILTVCYAAGLRISEAVRLRSGDIDSQRMVIRVRQGKGQKDRYVMLSAKLLEILRDWWRHAKPTTWLFPGKLPGRHISKDAVEPGLRESPPPLWHRQTDHAPLAPARVCRAPARIRRQHSHDSAAARSS
jgi:integrase